MFPGHTCREPSEGILFPPLVLSPGEILFILPLSAQQPSPLLLPFFRDLTLLLSAPPRGGLSSSGHHPSMWYHVFTRLRTAPISGETVWARVNHLYIPNTCRLAQ